jgi:hypothetical protein
VEKMTEKDYYEPVRNAFEKLFSVKGQTYLEITAEKPFSNKIKEKIPDHRGIVFSFLKDVRPDITGFFKRTYSDEFIIIEIKNEPLKIEHIYQAKRYAELLDTRFAFLVSTEEIPNEIKKLTKAVSFMLSLPYYKKLILCQFDEKRNEIADWYEENPFEKESNWK